MDETERAFIKTMLQTHRSHLQVLEQQAATFGVLAPPYVVTQIAEYQQKIAELEARLRPPSSRRTEGPRHNLPPRDYERFVGRQKELAELRRLLSPQSRAFVVTIDGIGGIGKSALALETAYSFIDQYDDLPKQERFQAIAWVSAKRTYLTASGVRERRQVFRTLEDLFASIVRVLDYPPSTNTRVDEQRAIVEDALREQRTLLVLDNLETVDDERLQDFLSELPVPTKAIVTTRHRIDVARPLRLAGMEHADALALIAQEVTRKDVVLSQEEQEELCKRTGGLPLAIVWTIGLLGIGGSVESVLRRLGSGQSDIARFCFEESVAQIQGRDAHKLLLALSLFPFDASREALGAVAGLGEDEFGRDGGLEDLLRLSLVNKDGARFSLLPLTRIFALDEATKQVEQTAHARTRWQEYFYQLAVGAQSNDGQARDRIERELVNAIAALQSMHAQIRYQSTETEKLAEEDTLIIAQASQEVAKKVLDFCSAVARVCYGRGYWLECELICNTAISIGKLLNEPAHVGWRLYDLCRIHFQRNDLEEARRLTEQALEAWGPRGQELEICISHIHRLIGQIEQQCDNAEAAEESFTTALAGYQQLNNSESITYILDTEANLAEQRGDLEEAAKKYSQALDTLSQNDNNIGYTTALLYNRGRLAFRKGDINQAREHHKKSLGSAKEVHSANLIARNLCSLAVIEETTGDYDAAKELGRQALVRCRHLGLVRDQAEIEALLVRLSEKSHDD